MRTLVGLPLLLFLLTGGAAHAARVEADPSKDYHVTPEVGPWMIIVTSYSGPDAAKFAHDLCLEVRSKYDLPAYVYNRGAEKRQQQAEELRQRHEQQRKFFADMQVQPENLPPLKTYRIQEEFAVLVGSYKEMAAARKDLDRIKKLDAPKSVPLPTLTLNGEEETGKGKKKDVNAKLNPFAQSFVVRNPLVRAEADPDKDKPDPFLKELNANEEFSLLHVKKPWTLVVKDFHGATVIQPQSAPEGLMKKLFSGKKVSMLDAGAHDAHEIARGLRAMGIDAYVLHTRWGSIVTVGAYDSQDDPKLLQNKRVLANRELGQGVTLFTNPLPMQVPQL